jgi:hypothetical protein
MLAVNPWRHPTLNDGCDLQRRHEGPADEHDKSHRQQEHGSKSLRWGQLGVMGPSPGPGKQAGPASRTVAAKMR